MGKRLCKIRIYFKDSNVRASRSLICTAVVIHWTRQIKEEVANQESIELSERAGPLGEIEFWRSRTFNLNSIEHQIQRKEVQDILKILEVFKSTYLEPFNRFSSFIKTGSAEAQENLKNLISLQEPCEKLAKATPVEIPQLLPDILNVIRTIWTRSNHYNKPERLISLLKKVFP
jgi:dynein heavy chain